MPIPWARLARDLRIHTRELIVTAGAPGAGKSVFALNLATYLSEQGLYVLYLAQDSAPSVIARLAALWLGEEITWVQDSLRDPDIKAEVVEELRDAFPRLFMHVGAITPLEIDLRLDALTEVLGRAPTVVIVDNLNDTLVDGHHHEEVGFYAKLLNTLKQMAIARNTCIIGLHHVTRRGGEKGAVSHGDGTRPLRMTDLRYAGEREAEHVLGIYHPPNKDQLMVQILKQRDGDADPGGALRIPLLWHPKLGSLARRV